MPFHFLEMFPLFAHLIDRVHAETGAPVTRDQIRDALLADPVGVEQVGAAVEEQGRDAETVAGNMVDWWSAEETKGTNPYAAQYVRSVIGGKAAYRPTVARTPLPPDDEDLIEVTGQGYQRDAKRASAVEVRAMADARLWLLTLGWTDAEITDTSDGNPYDLLAERPGQQLFVEVKGVTGNQPVVFVTAGEVRHAVDYPDECALFVLTGITVTTDDSGNPQGSDGTRRVFMPWRPEEGTLRAVQYRHVPSEAQEVRPP